MNFKTLTKHQTKETLKILKELPSTTPQPSTSLTTRQCCLETPIRLKSCTPRVRKKEVVNLFLIIHSSGFFIDGSTISCVLKACSLLFGRNFGVRNVSVGTALLDMYLKNESVEEGRRAFDEIGERNMKEWLRREFKMVIKNGFGAATFACNALINMYFESRKIRDGRGVFDGLKDKECC
ncbi:hypothetical protein NC652_024053 [Populus alba x Populus x berolinensis]|nr:hypothetical protein NC652_024053 [Populus alba x Populus x berolinensis]